jgi:hypothetical protein
VHKQHHVDTAHRSAVHAIPHPTEQWIISPTANVRSGAGEVFAASCPVNVPFPSVDFHNRALAVLKEQFPLPRLLRDPDVVAKIEQEVQRTGVAPNLPEIESRVFVVREMMPVVFPEIQTTAGACMRVAVRMHRSDLLVPHCSHRGLPPHLLRPGVEYVHFVSRETRGGVPAGGAL